MTASMRPTVALRASIVTAALLGGSCGIDQGGYLPPDPSTAQPAQTVLVSGPIDAFGSVHVNGLVLDTSRAQVRIDGVAASEADLRVGQMIRTVVQVSGGKASALSIEYEQNVVGSVASVDAAAGVEYWVYLPPAESRAQLDRALAELAALGIGDYYVVQEATPWRNAVSLGIFKTEESAQTFLQSLRTRGVKSAIVGHRDNFLKHIAYFVRDPNQATIAKLAELQRAFPGTQMKAVACPTTLD